MRFTKSTQPINPWLLDRYSLAHFAWGVAFAAHQIPAPIAIGTHVAFELVEDKLKPLTKAWWPVVGPDSIINRVGDIASFTTGFYAARALKKAGTPGIVAITGVVSLGIGVWMWNLLHRHTWAAST